MASWAKKVCRKKKVYNSLLGAILWSAFFWKHNGTNSQPYKCKICKAYHLTSN